MHLHLHSRSCSISAAFSARDDGDMTAQYMVTACRSRLAPFSFYSLGHEYRSYYSLFRPVFPSGSDDEA